MPVHSRNLLLFAVLAAAALLTWMLARNTEQESLLAGDAPGAAPQGYFMRDTRLYGTNDDGAIAFRVDAARLERQSTESDFSLEEVRVEYSGTADVAWLLTSARGTMPAEREQLDLQSVRVRAEMTGERADESENFVFEARDLSLDLRAKTASTDQSVQLRRGQCESNARGLNVDLNTDTFELPESETTCRRRAGPALVPALSLALATGSALAQDDTPGRITKLCYPEEGRLLTNEYTCKDAVITDNESFRVTAGLISVTDERGLVFDQIEWRLTEGVRIELETAVMVAETATMVWDGDGMLRSFDLVGTPTEFSDIIDGRSNPIRVMAPRMVFSRESGTLKSPGAFQFLEDGEDGSKGSGCDLTYWLEEKRWVIGNSACPSELSLAPTAAEDPGEEPPAEP
jgi:LPS export ABC transporter protein LptC